MVIYGLCLDFTKVVQEQCSWVLLHGKYHYFAEGCFSHNQIFEKGHLKIVIHSKVTLSCQCRFVGGHMRCCLALIMRKKVWVIIKRKSSVASMVTLFRKQWHRTRRLFDHAHPEFGVFFVSLASRSNFLSIFLFNNISRCNVLKVLLPEVFTPQVRGRVKFYRGFSPPPLYKLLCVLVCLMGQNLHCIY